MNALLIATLLTAGRVLTLDEALETARTHQPQLRQAAAEVRAAQARVTQARAPMLPQVNASLRYGLSTTNRLPQVGTNTVGTRTDVPDPADAGFSRPSLANSTNGSVQVTQLLWDFGQSLNRLQAAQLSADAAGKDALTRMNAVLYNVRAAFFSALAAKELLLVARETLANQDRHFGQVSGFVEVGTRPAIDLAQARTDRANARVQLIGAQNGYASARAALNQAMGVEGPTDYDVGGDRLSPLAQEDRPLEEMIEQALAERPEVDALQSRMRAQQELVAAARGAYGPSLSIFHALNASGADTNIAANVTLVGLSLNWNLFNGLGDWARVQEADAVVASLSAQLDTLRLQVRFELEQAQLAVHGASESLVAAEEALLAARDRLRLAEGRYETGVGNIIELGDAQLSLTNAAAQKVRAEFDVSTARAGLLRTLGSP